MTIRRSRVTAARNVLFFGLLFCLASSPTLLWAQAYPITHAETLSGAKIDFPEAIQGKAVVCVFAFSHEAGGKIRPWTDALSKDQVIPVGTELWSVADVEGAPSIVRGMIRSSFRKSTPQSLWEHTLVMTSNSKVWQRALHVTHDKVPMVVLFDASGHVTWIHEGLFDSAALDELKAHLPAPPQP